MVGMRLAEEYLCLIFEMCSEMVDMKFWMEQMEHMQRILLDICLKRLGMGPTPPVTTNPNNIIPLAQKHEDKQVFKKNKSHDR